MRFGQDVVFDKASKDTYAFDQPEVPSTKRMLPFGRQPDED